LVFEETIGGDLTQIKQELKIIRSNGVAAFGRKPHFALNEIGGALPGRRYAKPAVF
jgi:hypothetical protein